MHENCQTADTDVWHRRASKRQKARQIPVFSFAPLLACLLHQQVAMRGKHLVRRLMAVSVVVIALVSDAHAQTKPTAPGTPAAKGAFDKLSLGNQKVAAALYYAQSPRSTNGVTHASRRHTLEELAAKRDRKSVV